MLQNVSKQWPLLASKKVITRAIAVITAAFLCVPLPMAMADVATTKPYGKTSYQPAPAIVSSGNKAANQFFELPLNKAKVIGFNAPISRVSVSNPEMVGVVVLNDKELQLLGKQVGSCSLLVWVQGSAQYLNVDLSVHRDVVTLMQKLKSIDEGVEAVAVPAEDAVMLAGKVSNKENAQLIYELAQSFFATGDAGTDGAKKGPKIINMIQVPGQPSTQVALVEQKLKEINPNIILTVVPQDDGKPRAILMGKVKQASEVSKAIQLAAMFYGKPGIKVLSGPGGNVVPASNAQDAPGSFASDNASNARLVGNMDNNVLEGSVLTDESGNVISLLQVAERPQIRCHIQILEVKKTVDFGSNFLVALDSNKVQASGNLNSTLAALATSKASITYAVGRELIGTIQALVQNGKARILAEPNIVTLSGEPATFLAGGEFPIPVSSQNGQVTVLFKEFGIRLNLLPTLTERSTIHMQVSPEVSSLDSTAGITLNSITIPGLRTRRSQAVVEMKAGDSFVLSGLYDENMSNNVGRVPLLGQIPILGELFTSRTYQKAETELVIVIRPEVLTDLNTVEPETVESQRIEPTADATVNAPATTLVMSAPVSTTLTAPMTLTETTVNTESTPAATIPASTEVIATPAVKEEVVTENVAPQLTTATLKPLPLNATSEERKQYYLAQKRLKRANAAVQ